MSEGFLWRPNKLVHANTSDISDHTPATTYSHLDGTTQTCPPVLDRSLAGLIVAEGYPGSQTVRGWEGVVRDARRGAGPAKR